MVAAHLSGQLHIPTTEVTHFDAALCKPEYFPLALLILTCNWFDPQKFVQTPLLARDTKCGQKKLLYVAALAKIHLQHRILLLPSQLQALGKELSSVLCLSCWGPRKWTVAFSCLSLISSETFFLSSVVLNSADFEVSVLIITDSLSLRLLPFCSAFQYELSICLICQQLLTELAWDV